MHWGIATLASLWVVILVLDLLVAAAVPAPEPEILPRSANAIRRTLAAAASAEHDSWLLLGDSVLAGDVLAGRVPDWDRQRVLDSLRSQSADGTHFEQVALDGMLPIDMLSVQRELDRIDPDGRVGLVVEINPRYFSRRYADQYGCTRDALCEVGTVFEDRLSTMTMVVEAGVRWLADHAPLVRHRDRLAPRDLDAVTQAVLHTPPTEVDRERAETTPDSSLAGQARVLEHYRGLTAHTGSVQYRALETIAHRAAARNRRVVFFMTPLNDTMLAGVLEDPYYGEIVARLDGALTGGPRNRLYSFDHVGFAPDDFVDHAHLRPVGNRRLALELLVALGVPLVDKPDDFDLWLREGVDRTLVGHVPRGSANGASWQALYDQPRGVAVDPTTRYLVIADTGNHVLRRVSIDGGITRVLAGTATERGNHDGAALLAGLDSPRNPVFVGSSLFFVDGARRRRVRELVDGEVRTIDVPRNAWLRAHDLATDGRLLYVLHTGGIATYDPSNGATQHVVTAPTSSIVAFDVAEDGRIFFADADASVWQSHRDHRARTSPTPTHARRVFDNRIEAPALPQERGETFPFDFEDIALTKVEDLVYVERYDGVLVADAHPIKAKTQTGRVHLRLLSLGDERVYPWIKPIRHGGGYMFLNKHAPESIMTNVHSGSMALHGPSGTVFWVERLRSRVLQLSDGLLGTAKLGHHITPVRYGGFSDVFGRDAGRITMQTHHPELWAGTRLERVPRAGPYFGLVLGSSMTSVSDVVGQYSMARAIEDELGDRLGLQDAIRLDIVQRAWRGPRFEALVDGYESFVDQQMAPDVVFFEIHSGRMYKNLTDEAQIVETLGRIKTIAQRHDTLVVFIDNDGMTASKRDGLRATSQGQSFFLQLAERTGITVVRPSDMLLREHLRHAPWGNPPFRGPHGATWAIDATAEAVARLSYPRVREHLKGREPAWQRDVPEAAVDDRETLGQVFARRRRMAKRAASKMPADAIVSHTRGRALELFVDLGKAKLKDDGRDLSEDDVDGLVLATLARAIALDPAGGLVTEVHVVLARFSSYDEYGVGQLEGADVVTDRTYDAESLAAWLKAR